MKFVLSAFAIMAGVAAFQPCAQAQNYPWCAVYGGFGSRNCGFTTFDQCMQSVRGAGGNCMQNTQYQGPTAAPSGRAPAAASSHHDEPKPKSSPQEKLVAPQPQ